MGMALTKTRGRGSEGSPPTLHGGGGGDPNGGSVPNYPERLKRARMGLAIALTPVIMLFVSFSAAFVARRLFASPDSGTAPQFQRWISIPFPWPLLLLNTLVLLLSGVTIELARRNLTRQLALAPVRTIPGVSLGRERRVPWLGFTIVLGLLFLLGQLRAWNQLEGHGVVVSSTPSSSFFYLLTGMHAVHLAGGIIALLYAGFAALRQYSVERQRIIIEVAAWYWHFMAGLWVYVLLLIAVAH
jgi:cytochrome c oxidase subunit III